MHINFFLITFENQMGKIAHSIKEIPPRSFPSDTEKNPKECKVITLRSGKELRDSKGVEKEEVEANNEEARWIRKRIMKKTSSHPQESHFWITLP